MNKILRIINKDRPLIKLFKYAHHSYFIGAVVYLMMCPAIHEFGDKNIEHVVVNNKTSIQKQMYSAAKSTASPQFITDLFCQPDSYLNTIQNISTGLPKTVNSISVKMIATTHLIL